MVGVVDFITNAMDDKSKTGAEIVKGLGGLVTTLDKAIDDLNALANKTPDGYTTEIEIGCKEFECIIDYTFIPACNGAKGRFGVPLEPDEPAYIEVNSVYIKDGEWQLIDIPESALEGHIEEILEHHTYI